MQDQRNTETMHSRDGTTVVFDLLLCTTSTFFNLHSYYCMSLLYLKIPNFLVYLFVNFLDYYVYSYN